MPYGSPDSLPVVTGVVLVSEGLGHALTDGQECGNLLEGELLVGGGR